MLKFVILQRKNPQKEFSETETRDDVENERYIHTHVMCVYSVIKP